MDAEFKSCFLNKIKEADMMVYSSESIQIGQLLGEGTFGAVHKGEIIGSDCTDKGDIVAIKLFNDFSTEPAEIESNISAIIDEISIMNKLNHPQIPKFYGIYCGSKVGLVFTYIEGMTLEKYIDQSISNLTTEDKLDIVIKITDIVVELHEQGLIHRDIKPENIMIQSDGKIFLLDFGISKISHKTTKTRNLKGTIIYSPPEANVLKEDSEDGGENEEIDISYVVTKKFDVWSIGCCIFKIFTGIRPWSNKFKDDAKVVLSLMTKRKYPIGKETELYFPFTKDFIEKYPEVFEIAKQCLIYKVENRLNCTELLDLLNDLKNTLV